MAKSSIGQFIAALRKVNGMTQQEVADRLNVSNKAVSRWERDECSPDISLIPVLAEMFGVTCDELLKGERILEPSLQEKKEPKVEKQVKNLINRTLSGFKTLIWISLAVSAVGLVCMFGISYGFYRPVIGFAVMLLFEVWAFVIAVLAVNKTNSVKNYNELFNEAEESLVAKFHHTLGSFSFTAFFVVLAVVLLSLPLIILSDSYYVESVLSIQSYSVIAVLLGALLAIIYIACRRPYIVWITGDQQFAREKSPVNRKVRKMSVIQIGLTVLAGLLFVIAPYGESAEAFSLYHVISRSGLACLAASVVCFIVFLVKNRDGRKDFVIPGIRNLFLILPARLISGVHSSGFWTYENEYENEGELMVAGGVERFDLWDASYLWYALVCTILIFVIFFLLDMLPKLLKEGAK